MLTAAEKKFLAGREYWTMHKPLVLFYRHELERALARALRRAGVALEGRRILEDGCGEGRFLRQLVEFGAEPARVYGVERDAAALNAARERASRARYVRADAAALPFQDGRFDVATQSVLFSSLPPGETRRRAATELARVLRPGGLLIWYDFVERAREGLPRGLELGEVRALFPGWPMTAYKFGLRFRWASVLVNKALWLAHLLAAAGVRRSHYVILLTKPE